MKKLLLLSLCSLFLVSCGSDFLENDKLLQKLLGLSEQPFTLSASDFLINEKSKHPERFYYLDRTINYPWHSKMVKVYDGNRLINEYKHVRSVRSMLRGSTKIKLSDHNEIFIGNNYNIVTCEEGYCVMLYNGDVICFPSEVNLEEYGYFSDYCDKSDEDDYKEFYNIKD